MKPDPLRPDIFHSQFARTVGKAYYRGADLGEGVAVARRIRRCDAASWHDEWRRQADVCMERGYAAASAGHRQSALQEFLRASEYYRQSAFFLRDRLRDPRLRGASEAMRRAFGEALPLLQYPSTTVELFHGGVTLRGYFFEPSGHSGEQRPTVINLSGYDSSAEELFFTGGVAALERGYNCLNIDGPGQGSLLWERGCVMRPDAEKVVGQALRWLSQQPAVDSQRVVLVGRSFAGYLAARAATRLDGLAALVVNPLLVNLQQMALRRMPALTAALYRRDHKQLLDIGARQLLKLSFETDYFFKARYAVHGVASLSAYLDALADYRCDDELGDIRCPVIVCGSDSDELQDEAAYSLLDTVKAPVYRLSFARAEGAGGHCTPLGQSLFNERVFDQLDALLRPQGVTCEV